MTDSLIGWDRAATVNTGPVWRPHALTREQWPPDYDAVYRWRRQMLGQLLTDPLKLKAMRIYYSTRPSQFIMDWMDTYDPRRKGSKWIPFVFFVRQEELVEFLEQLSEAQQSGLVEKARDMGATWVAVGYAVWRYLFVKGDSIGWGSRKEGLVDRIGDPDSIFEKQRLVLSRMPSIWLPENFSFNKHCTFMKIVNPQNGSTITGEAGDSIGRGGRKSMYLKDEAAHYERPEKIESALGDNTNVQVDISSVNGVGNVFHRRRENGVMWVRGEPLQPGFVSVFIMDWRDHPAKDQKWYDERKARYEREGMAHIFAQEVDRNYSAALENVVVKQEWVEAAVDAHLKVPYLADAEKSQSWFAGLDVADEGLDRNALTMRQGIIWRSVEEWRERDPGVTARRAIVSCRPYAGRIQVMYDSVGVGAGVKTEYNRLTADEKLIDPRMLPFIPWNAGASVLWPHARIIPNDMEAMTNFDYYHNLKAQAWGSIRSRFYKTYMAVTQGAVYAPDELISLDSRMPLLEQLKKELSQPTMTHSGQLKMLINKTPEGTKSPNLADGGVMSYFPVPHNFEQIYVGSYGT